MKKHSHTAVSFRLKTIIFFVAALVLCAALSLCAGIGALADRGRRLWDVVARFFPKDRDDDIRFKF